MNDAASQGLELPGYRLVRPIGRGGAATVYLAMQRSLERQVAVKVFDALDEASIARIEQLLRTNVRLSHPHIAGMHQIGRNPEGRLYYSMPLLISSELSRQTLRIKPLTVAAAMRELLEALAVAHRRGIVHGGIKPSNVLFDAQHRAQLADFGIARCAADLGHPHPAGAAYAAPEQARGDPPGQRSDLYSLGIVAWEFLAGALPFHGDDAVSTAIAHIEQPIPRLPPAASAWQPWIDKALAKSPNMRFQSAEEMEDALFAIDGKHRRAGRIPAVGRLRAPAWAWGIAALVVACSLAVVGWSLRGQPAPPVPAGVVATATADTAAPDEAAGTGTASPSALETRVGTLIARADAQRAGGHLFTPAGNNAAEQYLAALVLDPGNPAATAGIDSMLTTLRRQLDSAWRDDQPSQAAELVKQCDLLATHSSLAAGRAWQAQRDDLAHQVGAAMAAAITAGEKNRMESLKLLANTLPASYPDGFDPEAAAQQAARPGTGTVLRDRGGPLLVYVPASGNAPAFAVSREEVTRAQYARFAAATGRQATQCREAYNPFSRMRNLTWQSPGFAQGSDHPVVCVSWNDAAAYAEWLSRQTGEPYRLPTGDEWLRAARGVPAGNACQLGNIDDTSRDSRFDNDRWPCNDGAAQTAPVGHYLPSGVGAYDMYGNVSEWLAGGGSGARVFRGLSWRDGSQQQPLGRRGTADSDVAYTNIGFRVVRVIDAAHRAPPRAAR